MDRRIPTIVVVGSIVLAVLGMAGCGSGSSGPSGASASTAEDATLTVYNAPATFHSIDNPPSGHSVGDLEIDTGILLTNPYIRARRRISLHQLDYDHQEGDTVPRRQPERQRSHARNHWRHRRL